MSHLLKPIRCPKCHARMDASTNVTGTDKPQPKDLSICFYCGELNQFDDNMNIVPAKIEDVPEEDRDLVLRAQERIRQRNQ